MANDSYHLSQRVDNYIKYRPRYPGLLIDLLKTECHLSPKHIIADVGSGTGILAELFLQNGNTVLGVEPDPDMRAGAEFYLQDFPNFTCIPASAEATGLPDHCFDFVTVGQAFHWFNMGQAKKEFARILAPQGWVVLAWNIQKAVGSPFLVDLQVFWETEAFWKPSSSSQVVQKQARAQAYRLSFEFGKQELIVPFFGRNLFRETSFENPLVCDFEGLKGRILSNGPALEPGDPNYPAMLQALEEIFLTHQTNGTVTIEHETRIVYGQLQLK